MSEWREQLIPKVEAAIKDSLVAGPLDLTAIAVVAIDTVLDAFDPGF